MVTLARGSSAPLRMRNLPRADRGWVVPAESSWRDGMPMLSTFDKARTLAIALKSSCSQCGLPFRTDDLYWRIFSQRDAAYARLSGNSLTLSAPGHEVCMLYAALACPFWARGKARLGRKSLLEPGAKRGSLAALIGFGSVVLLVQPGMSLLGEGRPTFRFHYRDQSADLRFRDPHQDLVDRYEALMGREQAADWDGLERVYFNEQQDGDLDDVLVNGMTPLFAADAPTSWQDDVVYNEYALYPQQSERNYAVDSS